MKNKLLTVLNQCIYNKSIEDFNVLIDLINIISDDKTRDIKITKSSVGLYASMIYDNKLLSIMFNDNEELMLSLPDDIGRTYTIENCSYNMQYNGIKALLSIE